MHGELKDRGFSILGFPCNDFGGQEPGTAAEIQNFCSTKYKVTFPLFEKVKIKKDPSPVYANLIAQTRETPAWNFSKYLVGKNGKVIKAYKSGVKPEDATLRADIEAALKQ
jgi:glutathione peroxidase